MRRRSDDTVKSSNTVELLDENDQQAIIQEIKLLYDENALKTSQYLFYACFVFILLCTVWAYLLNRYDFWYLLYLVHVCITHWITAHVAKGIRILPDLEKDDDCSIGKLGIIGYVGIFMTFLSLLFSYVLTREETWLTDSTTLWSFGNLMMTSVVCYMRIDTYHSYLQLHDLVRAKYNHKTL